MTQKWNLQDIRPAEPRRRPPTERQSLNMNRSVEPRRDSESTIGAVESISIVDGNKRNSRNFFIVAAVLIFVIGSIFGLSAMLSKTTLTVYPEYYEPVVNAEFTAYPEKRDGNLSYEIITIDSTKEAQVKATGQEYAETKTEGYIEISKSTPGAEQLVKNTRFRSGGGQVFRIQEGLTVPGAIKDSTGKLVPGSIRAKVVADAAGQEFNLPSGTKFDVPGFKESNLEALYTAITAINQEDFTGGFKGQKFMINDADLSTKRQELQLALRTDLLERIKTEKPAGFTTFDNSVAITYTALPPVSNGPDLVTIREQAVLQMPLFTAGDFAAFLAGETITTYNRKPIRITDTSALTFSYVDSNTSSNNIANLTELKFKLSGKPTLVSEFDSAKLQADLAGKAKTAIVTVLTAHPGIKSARVASKPFWRRSFPEKPSDIKIVEVVGEEK